MSIGPHLLGRTLEHDPASRNYRATVPTGRLKPVTHTLAAPHLDQRNLGSCEGNTAAEFLNSAKALNNRAFFNSRNPRKNAPTTFESRKYLTEDQAVELYSKATTLDNDEIPGAYPPSDTGTSGNGVAKAMRAMGGLQTYNWTFTFNDFLAKLQEQPIMLGLNWYDSMFEYLPGGLIIEPPPGADPAGGHAVLAFSMRYPYTADFKVGCTNHWVNEDGSIWGVPIGKTKGAFWFHGPFLEQLLIHEQGDSLVPVLM